jgi:hypothetical protein
VGDARRYLLKDRVLAIDDFIQSVNRVAAGGTAIDPDVVSQLLGRRRAHDPLDELTLREQRDPRPHGGRPLQPRHLPKALPSEVDVDERHVRP